MVPASAPAAIAEQVKVLYGTEAWANLEDQIKPLSMRSVDVALFGAMATTSIFPNVYAACQVSHALSVNRTQKAVDFFTTIDDRTGDSRMIGEALFNANCYYHSIVVDFDQLCRNLEGDRALALTVLSKLIEAVYTISPSGKQHTFASHPLADLLLVELIDGIYFDYVNAFEKPIEATDELPLVEGAATALKLYTDVTDRLYPRKLSRHYVSALPCPLWDSPYASETDLAAAILKKVAAHA